MADLMKQDLQIEDRHEKNKTGEPEQLLWRKIKPGPQEAGDDQSGRYAHEEIRIRSQDIARWAHLRDRPA